MYFLAKLGQRKEEAEGEEKQESKVIMEWVAFLHTTAQGSITKKKT